MACSFPRHGTPRLTAVMALALSGFAGSVGAQSLGSSFTYQGRLTESGQSASGLYDLQVCLFDSPSNPVPIGCAPDFADVPVEDGVFTLALDFGPQVFNGQQRYLELRVRPGAGSGDHTVLAPRQPVRAVPEALRANAARATPWQGITGMPQGFADGIDNDSGGTVTAIVAGTGLSGGSITSSGTIGIADGGVGSAQLAAGAVGTAQIADGSVGLSQIDTAQVQARIGGSCKTGEYVRGINADGSLACDSILRYLGINLTTTVDDPVNNVGSFTSIAIGADGLPVISYWDGTAGTLKVAKCGNPVCTGGNIITTVDDPPLNEVGRDTSIAVGTDGLPVISYWDATARALKVAKCGNAACTSGTTITTVDDPPDGNNVGRRGSIAISADNRPVISYWDATAGALKVAKCGNASCSSGNVVSTLDDPTNTVGDTTSITIGTDGLPIISYYDNTAGALKVAKCGNASCTSGNTITTVDDPPNRAGFDSSIAIGSDGLPLVSYHDVTAGSLKVAKCGNASCSSSNIVTTIDNPASNTGRYSDIAFGPDGLPVIVYGDDTTGDLMVAKCGNAACTSGNTIITLDDTENEVGVYTSIAIGADGLPVISHYDATARTLLVTKCGRPGCQ